MRHELSRADVIDSLRTHPVMVAPNRNGRATNGYGRGFGPSHHRGDLPGITQAIPTIADLGFNALLLTPVFDTRGEGALDSTAYFPENYFAIDPHFGTEQDFRELVDTAHARGLAVFLDCPFGHHKNQGWIEPSPGPRPRVPSACSVPDPFGIGFMGGGLLGRGYPRVRHRRGDVLDRHVWH